MSKLKHSQDAFIKSLQVSSKQIYIFVEGRQGDPYFYSCVCKSIKNPSFEYRIYTADDLPFRRKGKQGLLTFFQYLRQAKKLTSLFLGKKTICVFFVDKDVDDIKRIKKRSPHLIYSKYYDIQNYIYEHGNIKQGVAVAASVDPEILPSTLNDASVWCLKMAKNWKHWISLCLLVLKENISYESNYGVASKIQTRACSSIDSTVYSSYLSRLRLKSGFTSADFDSRYLRITNRVDFYFANRDHHKIFKGKWFTKILVDYIALSLYDTTYDNNSLVAKLPSTIIMTLDFSESWVDDFREPLMYLLEDI